MNRRSFLAGLGSLLGLGPATATAPKRSLLGELGAKKLNTGGPVKGGPVFWTGGPDEVEILLLNSRPCADDVRFPGLGEGEVTVHSVWIDGRCAYMGDAELPGVVAERVPPYWFKKCREALR